MNLNYIREFVTLTQVGKFQEAANVLYISQSTLSKHINTLEKELGGDLFVGDKKRTPQLTAFGKSFLPYALQLTNIYNEMSTELLRHTGNNANKITIGSAPIVTLYTIFNFFDAFLQKNPDFHIEVVDAPQETLYELLRNGTCDLIVVQDCEASPDAEFNKIFYAQDDMAILLPKDHPLAGKESVTFSEIASERFIQISQSPLANTLEKLGLSQGFDIQKQITVGRASAVIDLIERHRGISMMPKLPADHFSNGRLAVVYLDPPTSVSYHILYPKNRALPPCTKALLEFLSE